MLSFLPRLLKSEHGYVQELLSAYLDGELTAQEKAAVERHLRECAACRRDLLTMRQTVELLRGLPELPLPRNFILGPAQVREGAARRPARPRPAGFPWAYPLLGGATALVAMLLVVVLAFDLLLNLSPMGVAPPMAPAVQEEPAADFAAVEKEAPVTAQPPPATAVARKLEDESPTPTPPATPVAQKLAEKEIPGPPPPEATAPSLPVEQSPSPPPPAAAPEAPAEEAPLTAAATPLPTGGPAEGAPPEEAPPVATPLPTAATPPEAPEAELFYGVSSPSPHAPPTPEERQRAGEMPPAPEEPTATPPRPTMVARPTLPALRLVEIGLAVFVLLLAAATLWARARRRG
jgi:hypothetical protein